MRRITVEERRARPARRHCLAPAARAEDVTEVCGDLVALHSTDPASVYLAAFARLHSPQVAAIGRGLYEDRTVVRMLGMRRTLFVVPGDLVPVVQGSCTQPIGARERRLLVERLQRQGIDGDAAGWLSTLEDATFAALLARGEATAAELCDDVPGLRQPVGFGAVDNPRMRQPIWPRVLLLLAAQGRIVRSRPRGSWVSGQYRWSPSRSWLGGDIAALPVDEARAALVRRWLAAFGPGTAADLKWWTGWTAAQVRQALSDVGPVEMVLDGGTGLVLADDLEPVPAVEPWVALLPALDSTVMGWAQRDWYLGPHRPALFDGNGNAGPTVWCDGRVVGGWGQRKGGQVVFRLLEDVGAQAAAAVRTEADRLERWLGDVRVTARFRTPLERELTA